MTRLLGDANPDLAHRFGLDTYQRRELEAQLASADHRVLLVTFQDAPERGDGKRDPIAYLPPRFDVYGILDRDHRHRARPGESWFVEVVERGDAKFLVPLVPFDVGQLGHYLPSVLENIADRIAEHHPGALGEHLSDERLRELDEVREAAQEYQELFENAKDQIERHRARIESLEAELEQLRTARPAPAPSVAVGPATPARIDPPHTRTGTTSGHVANVGRARRDVGDVLHSQLFTHHAYSVRFTIDLAHLHLRPDRHGEPVVDGSVEVKGLARADPESAPRSYPLRWDDDVGAFVVQLHEGTST